MRCNGWEAHLPSLCHQGWPAQSCSPQHYIAHQPTPGPPPLKTQMHILSFIRRHSPKSLQCHLLVGPNRAMMKIFGLHRPLNHFGSLHQTPADGLDFNGPMTDWLSSQKRQCGGGALQKTSHSGRGGAMEWLRACSTARFRLSSACPMTSDRPRATLHGGKPQKENTFMPVSLAHPLPTG